MDDVPRLTLGGWVWCANDLCAKGTEYKIFIRGHMVWHDDHSTIALKEAE